MAKSSLLTRKMRCVRFCVASISAPIPCRYTMSETMRSNPTLTRCINKFWMAPIYAQVSTDLHSLLRRFIELPECAILPRRSLQGSFQRWKVNRPGIIGFIAACIGRKSWTISPTPVRCAIVTAVIIERFCVGAFLPYGADEQSCVLIDFFHRCVGF